MQQAEAWICRDAFCFITDLGTTSLDVGGWQQSNEQGLGWVSFIWQFVSLARGIDDPSAMNGSGMITTHGSTVFLFL